MGSITENGCGKAVFDVYISNTHHTNPLTLSVTHSDFCTSVNGSGFYSVDCSGQYVYFVSQYGITICGFDFWDEYNLIDLEKDAPAIVRTDADSGQDSTVLMVGHPVGYSFDSDAGRDVSAFTTSSSAGHYVTIEFTNEYTISRVVFMTECTN